MNRPQTHAAKVKLIQQQTQDARTLLPEKHDMNAQARAADRYDRRPETRQKLAAIVDANT